MNPDRPWTPPEAALDIVRREFDAAREAGGVCQLTFHPFVIGHRARVWMLDALLSHARARGAVRMPTHADLVAWLRQALPARNAA